ncbi:ABC transporter substrate-binding protein [Microbacterium resistens]|uniref:ABC transporter substrate-binding protein n=1 Tax=Microbacterium resistens TaxID=156977 RepID=UPI0022EFFC34|nr:ABC transporter substrate-binding protein [Streptomyces sp. MS2A]
MRSSRLLAGAALVAAVALGGTACAPTATTPAASQATTRTVTTDYGDVEVPARAERIVVLNYALAGYLYDLDQPVAATIPEDADAGEGAFSAMWGDGPKEDGTVFLPWSVDGFDLESILALQPDLIIGGGIGFPLFQAEKVYDDLSDIAPTVLVGKELDTWQEQFSFLAEHVFGQKDAYDEFLAAYEKRVDEVKGAITPPPGPVAYVAMLGDGRAFPLVESVGLPKELAAVGIEPAPIFADGDFEVYGGGGDMFELSTEQVGQTLTQPTLIFMGFNADTTDIESLAKNPVYAALPAFQSGQAHLLPYWTLRGDYDEAMATLDEIEELFG